MSKKGNFNKNNEKKMKNNYFTQNVQRKGENFLAEMRPDTLSRDAIRIFREMTQGRINFQDCEQYIGDPTMLATLINVSYNRWAECNIIHESLAYYISQNSAAGHVINEGYISAQEKYKSMRDVYAIINCGLQTYYNTRHVGDLIAMGNILNKYINTSYLLY